MVSSAIFTMRPECLLIRGATDAQALAAGLHAEDLPGPQFLNCKRHGIWTLRRLKNGTLGGAVPRELLAARDAELQSFIASITQRGAGERRVNAPQSAKRKAASGPRVKRLSPASRLASAMVRWEVKASVLLATVTGVIGANECDSLLQMLPEEARAPRIRGIVLDLRGAALALSTTQYLEVLNAELADPVRLRMALVVGDGLVSMAQAHRNITARRGLERRLFTHEPSAWAWVQGAAPAATWYLETLRCEGAVDFRAVALRPTKPARTMPSRQDDVAFQKWKVLVKLGVLLADGRRASEYEWTEAERRAHQALDWRPYAQLTPAEKQAANAREHRLLEQDRMAQRPPSASGSGASRARRGRG